MKILKKFDLNRIKNKKWYHQRFDGCPLFINFITEAEVKKEARKPKGTEADIRVCFYDEGKADWHLDMKDVKRGAEAIIKLAKEDSDFSKKLLAKWKKDEKKFEDFFFNFVKLDLIKLSNKSLESLWRRYHKLAINRLTSSSIIDHFALGTDEIVGKMLRSELKGLYQKESEFTKLFSIATAPVHQSFINQAEIDLLKIILKKSKETLEQYRKRYYWSKNNYFISQELSIKDFEEEIKSWKKSGRDLNSVVKKIEETPEKNRIDKVKLFKKIKVSPLLRNLIKISEEFTWWQDERKRATYFNIHIGYKLLEEISARLGYKLEELKNATASEIDNIFKTQKPSRKELQERLKGCAILADRTGYFITTGREVDRIKKIILRERDLSTVQDFRGLSASVGRAIGRVRIVKSSTETAKVTQGDILVAVMTRPDYVVAMKKAAAIVTNEGGITSHAAIVSRELGIPCIIGTKIATEVLKDGDMVKLTQIMVG